jgi:hypothetical protein
MDTAIRLWNYGFGHLPQATALGPRRRSRSLLGNTRKRSSALPMVQGCFAQIGASHGIDNQGQFRAWH